MRGATHVTYPFLLAGLLTALFPTAAAAQQVCDERDNMLGKLAQKYGEAPVAIGVTNQGGLVEVLTTADGKTWTIIISLPSEPVMSCLVAAGEGWRRVEPEERGPEA